MQLLLNGRMPRTWQLGHEWWETPNIHLCTLTDFEDLCTRLGIVIETRRILGRGGARRTPLMPNLLAEQAVYLLSRR
jgi:methionine biosynthesis protein MetW